MILPGATVGMIGGGQLGRMFTLAARSMGFRVVVLDPDPASPAGGVADQHLCAAYDEVSALQQLAELCDVVTTEFENVPADSLRWLSSRVQVFPSGDAVETIQNRIHEKRFIRDCGLQTAPFIALESTEDLASVSDDFQFPAILKVAQFGYDGKGQVNVESSDMLMQAWDSLGRVACVLEQRIDLQKEVSVVLGRSVDATVRCFPVGENEHRQGILHRTVVPAAIDKDTEALAQQQAIRVAEALDYVGVMAVEFFIDKEDALLVNEIAPRTHNSGHFTLDACITSQFEQQLRAICGLPLGDTALLSPVVMVNLLGDLWRNHAPDWTALLEQPALKLYLYGKKEARSGRKMGHFCWLGDDAERLRETSEQLFQRLV